MLKYAARSDRNWYTSSTCAAAAEPYLANRSAESATQIFTTVSKVRSFWASVLPAREGMEHVRRGAVDVLKYPCMSPCGLAAENGTSRGRGDRAMCCHVLGLRSMCRWRAYWQALNPKNRSGERSWGLQDGDFFLATHPTFSSTWTYASSWKKPVVHVHGLFALLYLLFFFALRTGNTGQHRVSCRSVQLLVWDSAGGRCSRICSRIWIFACICSRICICVCSSGCICTCVRINAITG